MAIVVRDNAPTGGWLERSCGIGVDTGSSRAECQGQTLHEGAATPDEIPSLTT
jgi:hypothetical protein